MITFSDNQMQAMENAHDAAFPRRFFEWWREHISPKAKTTDTEQLIFAHRDEFQIAGLREEEDKFLFLYARAKMPHMGDRQYLETMDAIMEREPAPERVERIRQIARSAVPNG